MHDITRLIQEYEETTNKCVAMLQDHFKVNNPWSAWRHQVIPKEGSLGDGNAVRFEFHGYSCTMKLSDGYITFTFSAGDRLDPPSPLRLWQYALARSERFPQFREYADLQTALANIKSPFYPSRRL